MASRSSDDFVVPENPHFETATSWRDARRHVIFEPAEPSYTAGGQLQSLAIFVRDHKMRDVPRSDRSLEAHYGRFSFSQSAPGVAEARRLALETKYGLAPQEARIVGREGRAYELGPEPPPGDIDGRPPAVVAWCDGNRFYLVASTELLVDELIRVAASVYG